jgi:hypothetical protein
VRQPWYPVEERYGIVFAYLGPPDRKPALPRYDSLEPLEEGDQYYSAWPIPGLPPTGLLVDFNWLQMYENSIDPSHVSWLHSQHSGYQIQGVGTTGMPENFYDPSAFSENITFERTEFGAKYDYRFLDQEENGVRPERVFNMDLHVPNVFTLPDYVKLATDARPDMVLWVVPSDDTHHRLWFSIRSSDPGRVYRFAFGIKQNGKDGWELTDDERQRFPGDTESQQSQGPITLHSEETLATTDRGVVMLRRLLRTMVDDVAAGRDPQGVCFVDGPPRHAGGAVFTVRSAETRAATDETAAPPPVPAAGA